MQCDLHPMSPMAEDTARRFDLGGPLPHNTSVCVSVEALNEVGLVSDRASSDCATVDATAPIVDYVGVGVAVGVHTRYQSFTDVIFANVLATDDMSSLSSVQWCISSVVVGGHRPCDLMPMSGAFMMNHSRPMVAGGSYPRIARGQPTHIGGNR